MCAALPMPVLILGILAVWRVTHLLWGEDGPGDVFVRLRKAAGHGLPGRLLDCFYCLSLWVAAPAAWALGGAWPDRALLWLGLSGGAILLERATAGNAPAHPPAWHVEALPSEMEAIPMKEEQGDVMLRESEVRAAP